MTRALAIAFAMLAAGTLLPSCSDPVRDKTIDALGPEAPGVPEGPRHRPGQPCLVCHAGDGPGNSDFSFGGTVYQREDNTIPLENAVVRILDSRGKKHEVATNCAGNFFVMQADYEPVYPVWVKILYGHSGPEPFHADMGTPIYREGGCAKCHGEKLGTESTGHVYLLRADLPPVPLPIPGCSQ